MIAQALNTTTQHSPCTTQVRSGSQQKGTHGQDPTDHARRGPNLPTCPPAHLSTDPVCTTKIHIRTDTDTDTGSESTRPPHAETQRRREAPPSFVKLSKTTKPQSQPPDARPAAANFRPGAPYRMLSPSNGCSSSSHQPCSWSRATGFSRDFPCKSPLYPSPLGL